MNILEILRQKKAKILEAQRLEFEHAGLEIGEGIHGEPLNRRFRRALNKVGYTIQELLIVMIIIAILFAAGFIGRSIYIERAKMTTLRSDFNNFEYALQQCLLENPTIGDPARYTIDKQIALINSYLSEEIKFYDGDDGVTVATDVDNLMCKKNDPWDMPYQMWITNANNTHTGDYDEETGTTIDDAKDTEYRIFIKCFAKNNKSADSPSSVDNDDCVLLIQMVNGEVKTATYGLDREKGAFSFDGDDKSDLTKAYSM